MTLFSNLPNNKLKYVWPMTNKLLFLSSVSPVCLTNDKQIIIFITLWHKTNVTLEYFSNEKFVWPWLIGHRVTKYADVSWIKETQKSMDIHFYSWHLSVHSNAYDLRCSYWSHGHDQPRFQDFLPPHWRRRRWGVLGASLVNGNTYLRFFLFFFFFIIFICFFYF